MRTLRLILNGKLAAEPAVRTAVDAVRARGHLVDVRVTWEPGQAEVFAQEACEQELDAVVAGGGDGTVNEVVRGLIGRTGCSTMLAVLPLGTANDFARSLGLQLDDPTAALTIAAEGEAKTIDVGLVNGQAFINVASGGFAAEVTARTSPELKNAIGGAAYSLTGLLTAHQLTPHACRLVAAGQSLDLSIATLAIGNGRLAGGGYEVAPQAVLDDGLLDLVIVPAVPLGDLPALVGELFHVSAADNQHILYWQLAQFELHFADEFQLNLDGEPVRGRAFSVQVQPQALSIAMPAAN